MSLIPDFKAIGRLMNTFSPVSITQARWRQLFGSMTDWFGDQLWKIPALLGDGSPADARRLLGLDNLVIEYRNRGDWVPDEDYDTSDLVWWEGTSYAALVSHHSSGDFMVDLNAGLWRVIGGDLAWRLGDSQGAALVGFRNSGEAAIARDMLAKARETIDLDDYTTFMEACEESVRTGRHVRLPGRNFELPAGTIIPGGVELRGVYGQTTITVVGEGALICGGNRITMRGIAFSGGVNCVRLNGMSGCEFERCSVTGSAEHGFYCDGSRNAFLRCTLEGCGLAGIALTTPGASRNRVVDCDGGQNGSFVIWVSFGANRNLLKGNYTEGGNPAELIGITRHCWGNRVIGNSAQDTLDNGISVTGYRNTVIGNVCQLNANHGIGVYGERNTIIGNICRNNGHANLSAPPLPYAGITCTPAFGGLARKNIIKGNVCDDDQPLKTQHYGVKVTTNSHIPWQPGAPVDAGRAYCFNGLVLYFSNQVGTTGTIPPTHTSGTASDGGVSWTFVEEYPANLDGWDNEIDDNQCNGNLVGPWIVQTANAQRIRQPGVVRNSVPGRQLVAEVLTIAQNPEGSIVAPAGSIAQRLDAAVPGIALMSKQSGAGNAGWLPVAIRHQGILANRPDLTALGNGVRGYLYWAIDVGAHGTQLTWHGTGWIDKSNGTLYPPIEGR